MLEHWVNISPRLQTLGQHWADSLCAGQCLVIRAEDSGQKVPGQTGRRGKMIPCVKRTPLDHCTHDVIRQSIVTGDPQPRVCTLMTLLTPSLYHRDLLTFGDTSTLPVWSHVTITSSNLLICLPLAERGGGGNHVRKQTFTVIYWQYIPQPATPRV